MIKSLKKAGGAETEDWECPRKADAVFGKKLISVFAPYGGC